MLTRTDRVRAALVLGVVVVLGAGFVLFGGAAAQQPPTGKAPDAGGGAAKTGESAETFAVRGRVLDPDGKPLKGVEVFVCERWGTGKELPPGKEAKDKDVKPLPVRATTEADGTYKFQTTKAEMDRNPSVVAVAKDLGPDWVPLTRANQGGGLPDLRLVKDDVPITGRVLDLESQPVAGATITVLRVLKAPGEDLRPYFRAWARREGYRRKLQPVGYEEGVMTSLEADFKVKTGADGGFRLNGLGRNRVAVLAVEAPGLERRVIEAVTSSGLPDLPKDVMGVVRGAGADHLLAPAKTITGIVREQGTGKPAPGVRVACSTFPSVGGALRPSVELDWAMTDAEGRYRLAGVAKAKEYHLAARGGPFIPSLRVIEDTPGLDAITADLAVERGVEVQGRLVDRATGRPVRGYVEYHSRVDNPHLKDFPGFTKLRQIDVEVLTGRDGTFSLAALPGPGVIVSRSWENRFTNGHSYPDVFFNPGLRPGSLDSADGCHGVAAVNPSKKDAKSLTCEIALDPGRTLAGTVVGPDGKPVAGALAWGVSPAFGEYDLDMDLPAMPGATFTASGLDDRNPRYLLFWHKEKGLGRAVLVWGDERLPLTVRLEQLGTVTGRLIGQDGKPLGNVNVSSDFYQSSSGGSHMVRQLSNLAVGEQLRRELQHVTVTTDAEGRFRMPRLVPGLTYDLIAHLGEPKGNRAFGEYLGRVAQDLPAPTGPEPKDLGTISITTKKPETEKP